MQALNPKELFSKMIARKAVPHALLFAGPKGEKEEAAHAFAIDLACGSNASGRRKALSKNHPDIHAYHPEGKTGTHPIESLRELSREVAMHPNESPYKIFIIHEAERMLPASANALLKTFEEPAPGTVMILLTEHPKTLLPTLASRCQHLFFSKAVRKKPDPLAVQLLDILSGQAPIRTAEKLCSILEEEKKSQEKALRQQIARDSSALEKSAYEKDIEGAVALRFQEKFFILLETILEWYRDVEAIQAGLPDESLFFPGRRDRLQACPPVPLEELEKRLAQTRLAIERSMKPAFCLEVLLTRIMNRR